MSSKAFTGVLALCLLVAACGTPLEQCISRAQSDIRVLDSLIAEVEGNIARGYAVEREAYTARVAGLCIVGRDKKGKAIKESCLKEQIFYRNRPVAIDLNAERAKLASMKAERRSKARAAEANIKACRAAYPED